MWIVKYIKIVLTIYFVTFVINSQAYAQVSSNRMMCFDSQTRIHFVTQFKGKFAILELKGHAHRLQYINSFISLEGDRWSVYQNNEIQIATSLPSKKYISIFTMPAHNLVADSFCD